MITEQTFTQEEIAQRSKEDSEGMIELYQAVLFDIEWMDKEVVTNIYDLEESFWWE